MNARISAPVLSLGESLSVLWDQELERNTLGAAMLGEPMPTWLEPRHFFPTQHQRIYEAVQAAGGNVAHVNAWLRESSPGLAPYLVRSDELAAMCLEWKHARDMGWALELEQLRELWRRRELLTAMQRTAVKLRAGDLSHQEARRELSEHFKEAGR